MLFLVSNITYCFLGWGEATFLALSSFYEQSTITAWSSGTGFAGIAGNLVLKIFSLTPHFTYFR